MDLTYPVRGGGTYQPSPRKILEWQHTYPELDVERELRTAWQWLQDNPRRLKKDVTRYLGNWLRRAATKKQRDTKTRGDFAPQDWGRNSKTWTG
ncbi:MAG TPA: hypothetical protein VM537_35800 [Anaerolineae bacterium]|nr:hypothetical protein [Anaerolineae bacterium]